MGVYALLVFFNKLFATSITYEEYKEDEFNEASNNWKVFYIDVYFKIIHDYVLYIMNRFDIRKKYEEKYDNIQNYITREIMSYMEEAHYGKVDRNTLNKEYVDKIKKILGRHYKDFNAIDIYFKRPPPDNLTADEFILKIMNLNMNKF